MQQNHNSENNNPDDNSIFEKLVVNTQEGSLERLTGVLAYTKYKLEEYKWLKNMPNASPEQKQAFLAVYDDEKLKEYRDRAEESSLTLMGDYADSQLNKKLSDLTNEIKQTKVKFMLPVWQSLLASVIFAIALFFLAVAIKVAAPNSGMGQVIKYLADPNAYELKLEEKKN